MTGNHIQRLWNIHGQLHPGIGKGPIKTEATGIEKVVSQDPFPLHRCKLVSNQLKGGVLGKIIGPEGFRVTDRIANKDTVSIRKIVIDSTLKEIFVHGPGSLDNSFRSTIEKIDTPGSRERPKSQIRCHLWDGCLGCPVLCEYNGKRIAGVSDGDHRELRLTLAFPQAFVSCEKEGLVGDDGSSQRESELIPFELRRIAANGGILWVQVEGITGVQIVIAVKIKQGAMQLIAAGFGDDVDHPAGRTPELRSIGRGLNPKLLHRLHA